MRIALVLLALCALLPGAAPGSAAQLRACGGYATSDPHEAQRSKNRCLAQAFRQGARASALVVSRGDRNGNLVAEHLYRVLGPNQLQLFVDVRKDRLGARHWHRFVCRELVVRASLLAPRRCLETPLTATGPWSRPQLVNCGRLARQSSAEEHQEAQRCLLRAFEQGLPAMFVRTGLTIDGGLVTRYYFVLAPGLVESLLDATAERNYPQQWYRALCTGLMIDSAGFLRLQDCRISGWAGPSHRR